MTTLKDYTTTSRVLWLSSGSGLGRNGNGSQLSPLDASTPDKLDAIYRQYPGNVSMDGLSMDQNLSLKRL